MTNKLADKLTKNDEKANEKAKSNVGDQQTDEMFRNFYRIKNLPTDDSRIFFRH